MLDTPVQSVCAEKKAMFSMGNKIFLVNLVMTNVVSSYKVLVVSLFFNCTHSSNLICLVRLVLVKINS